MIVEHKYSQVDADGEQHQLLDCISDHRMNCNATESDGPNPVIRDPPISTDSYGTAK